ncbi:hypothetical protein IAU59_002068 [Kwoniella sp. CBS 9459]
MSSPLQPLFTTSPLYRPPLDTSPNMNGHPQTHFQPFYASPISTNGSHDPSSTPFGLNIGTGESIYKHAGSMSQPSSAQPSAPPSPIFEELSFAKQPIPSSTAVSTDSEAFSSDWPGSGYTSPNCTGNGIGGRRRSGAQSPSLISTLFACQPQSSTSRATRQSQGSSSCSSSSAHRTPSLGSRCSAKPILRRNTASVSMSTSASEDCRELQEAQGQGPSPFTPGYGLGIAQNPAEQTERPLPLKKRPSALTFAVTSPKAPMPHQVQSSVRSQSQSRSHSRTGSISPNFAHGRTGTGRIAMSPPSRIPSWSTTETDEAEEDGEHGDGNAGQDDDDDDDEDEDDDDYVVESPLPIPGHESDSDEGYQEDSEGGFTSEEDVDGEDHGDGTFTTAPRLRHRPSWAAGQWAATSRHTGALTPKRRVATIDSAPAYPTSTDDYEAGQAGPFDFVGFGAPSSTSNHPSPGSGFRGRKTSIAIVANSKPSSNRCTRHRSPPPPSRSRASSKSVAPAPPAARSPSAAELCRRRGSASVQNERTVGNANNASANASAKAKGWRSDDSAFFPSRKSSIPMNSATFQLPSACTSTSTSAFGGHASNGRGLSRPHVPRKGSLPTPGLSNRCRSILRPPSSIPMQRSSGCHSTPAAVPGPKTHKAKIPSVDVPAPAGLLRRGSEPVGGMKDAHRRDTMSSDHCHIGTGMGMGVELGLGFGQKRRPLARSVTAYEGEGPCRGAN